jgi:hypothetical protein
MYSYHWDSFALGIGQGLIRLLQFSGILASETTPVRPLFPVSQRTKVIVHIRSETATVILG